MKTFLIFFALLYSLNVVAQSNLSSIKYNKEYKTISLTQPIKEKSKIIQRDTIRLRDTIFLTSQNKIVKDPEHFNNEPLIKNVYSPLSKLEITSNYGMRFHPIKKRWIFHSGVDLGANNDTVRSVIDGTVHSSGYNSGLGYYVKVQSGNYVITYGHLSQYFCLEEMNILAGQPIGITGNTGLSTGEHLHFSVHQNGNSLDPIDFLKSLIRIKSTFAINQNNHITHERNYQTVSN